MIGRVEMRLRAAGIVLLMLWSPTNSRGATDVDFFTNLTIGCRGGLFAVVYSSGDDVSADQETGLVSMQVILLPGVVFALSTERTAFEMNYHLELSNRIIRGREFALNFLHRPGLRFSTRLTSTTTLSATAGVRIGALGYSSASQLSDTENDNDPNPPDVSEIRLAYADAMLQLTEQLSRLSSISVIGLYRGRLPYGYQEGDTLPFSKQHQNTLQLEYIRHLTRRNSLLVGTSGSLVLNSPGPDFIPVEVTIGLTHTLSEYSVLSASAGVMMAYLTEIDHDDSGDGEDELPMSLTYWLPQVDLSYQGRFNLRRGRYVSTGLTGGFNGYFDRVTASVRQQIRLAVSVALSLPPRWTIVVQGVGSSLITPEPTQSGAEVTTPPIDYPTTTTVNVEGRYFLSREISLRFGISSSARWSHHMGDPEFRARAFEEFIVYLSVVASKNHLE